MAIEFLETKYDDKSHYTITVNTDFTPTAMKYSVFDEDDNVVNSLSSQSVTSPSTATEIELDGNTLAISDAKKTDLYVTVYGTYNGGANSFSGMCVISGNKLKGVP